MREAVVHIGKNKYHELSARKRGKYRLTTEAHLCDELDPFKLKDTYEGDDGIIGRF